jgi:regulatory protein
MTDTDLIPEKAVQYAYRILSVRPLSEKEFQTKLKGKGFGGSVAETVAARFRELGYLNDASLAKQLARSLAVNRLWGNRRIEISLMGKGIAREFIGEAVAAAREEITERAAVIKFLGIKGKGQRVVPEDRKEKHRLMQSLMGKGFPPGLIFEILSLSGEEDVDDGE